MFGEFMISMILLNLAAGHYARDTRTDGKNIFGTRGRIRILKGIQTDWSVLMLNIPCLSFLLNFGKDVQYIVKKSIYII